MIENTQVPINVTTYTTWYGNWTFRPSPVCPPDVSPRWRIQRFLVTLYILSFIIVKLCLTTFIKVNANDDDDPAYSVKTQAPGAKRLGGETSRGELTKGRNVHKSEKQVLVLTYGTRK